MAVNTTMIGETRPDPVPVDSGPATDHEAAIAAPQPPQAEEIGGRGGLDPVRYGDWEKNGRCIDF
jgi:hypothetical protein